MPKADLQSAMLDHNSYTMLPFAEYWVDTANSVSRGDVIEQKTKAQHLSHTCFSERSGE